MSHYGVDLEFVSCPIPDPRLRVRCGPAEPVKARHNKSDINMPTNTLDKNNGEAETCGRPPRGCISPSADKGNRASDTEDANIRNGACCNRHHTTCTRVSIDRTARAVYAMCRELANICYTSRNISVEEHAQCITHNVLLPRTTTHAPCKVQSTRLRCGMCDGVCDIKCHHMVYRVCTI